jgi:hypothetical protein
MPVYGKRGKDEKAVFPTLPTDLGNRCGDSHIPTAKATTGMYICDRPLKPHKTLTIAARHNLSIQVVQTRSPKSTTPK